MQDQKARLVRCSKQLFANKGNVQCSLYFGSALCTPLSISTTWAWASARILLKEMKKKQKVRYPDSNPSAALALGRAAMAAYQSAYYLPPFFS